MLEYAPLTIAGLALLLAALPIPGLMLLRRAMVIFALGCGQIYIAMAALGVMLLIDTGWRFHPPRQLAWLLWSGLLVAGILVTTALDPGSSRTSQEIAQLFLYIIFFVLMLRALQTGEDLLAYVRACVLGGSIVMGMAALTMLLGLQSAPDVFLSRGPNEGAVFLGTLCALPAVVMLVRTRNPIYLAVALTAVYFENLATSRGSVVASLIAIGVGGFILIRSAIIRSLIVLAALYLIVTNIPVITAAFQSELNFSARERLALFEYGIYLFEQRPILGWGWGSTTDLAQQTPTTELVYPHFHNTVVQLLVEAGVVGIAIMATFLYFIARRTVVAIRSQEPAVITLVAGTGAVLIVSSFFDAMLYGADRAAQVIILLALTARATGMRSNASFPLEPLGLLRSGSPILKTAGE